MRICHVGKGHLIIFRVKKFVLFVLFSFPHSMRLRFVNALVTIGNQSINSNLGLNFREYLGTLFILIEKGFHLKSEVEKSRSVDKIISTKYQLTCSRAVPRFMWAKKHSFLKSHGPAYVSVFHYSWRFLTKTNSVL